MTHTALLILTLVLGPTSSDLAPTPYANEAFGFRIAFPAGLDPVEAEHTESDDFSAIATGGKGATTWQCSVRVAYVDPGTTAAELVEKSLKRIEERKEYSLRRQFVGRLGKHEVPGLALDVESGGVTFRMHAFFLVRGELRTIVQVGAGNREFAKRAEAFNAFLRSFESVPLSQERRDALRLDALARRCGSDLDWAADWSTAAARSRREGKLILVAARFYSGFDISDTHATGPLFDHDVRALIEERFVPLRLRSPDQVPFSAPDGYGLGSSTLGAAFLVVASSGQVIRETPVVHPIAVDEFLRETLRSTADSTSPAEERTGLELARYHFRRGELDESARVAGTLVGPEPFLLQGRIQRRLRRAESALEWLERAKANATPRTLAEVILEESRVLAGSDRPEAARNALRTGLERGRFVRSESEVAAGERDLSVEARVRLGLLVWPTEGIDATTTWLEEVIAENPRDRWSWLAAAILSSTAVELGVVPSATWPSAEVLDAVRRPSPSPATITASSPLSAIEYLLERQREDGSWPHPDELSRVMGRERNPIAEAINTIAARTLIPYRAQPRVREAILRTLERVRSMNAEERDDEFVHYMDYWVWTKCYELWFVAECIAHDLADADELRAVGSRLVSGLESRQRASGGWSYYLTRDLGSAEQNSGSISFVTAAVTRALLRATEVEIEVSTDAIARGLQCLEAMRAGAGLYSYHGSIGVPAAKTSPGASAGRGPVCALALHRGKRVDLAEVRAAVELFLANRAGLAREQGKSLMHAGPEGQGSHYVLFDYATAAEAVAALPPELRAEFRAPILELIAAARTADGGYVDMPGIGRVFGTAMALEIYTLLDVK